MPLLLQELNVKCRRENIMDSCTSSLDKKSDYWDVSERPMNWASSWSKLQTVILADQKLDQAVQELFNTMQTEDLSTLRPKFKNAKRQYRELKLMLERKKLLANLDQPLNQLELIRTNIRYRRSEEFIDSHLAKKDPLLKVYKSGEAFLFYSWKGEKRAVCFTKRCVNDEVKKFDINQLRDCFEATRLHCVYMLSIRGLNQILEYHFWYPLNQLHQSIERKDWGFLELHLDALMGFASILIEHHLFPKSLTGPELDQMVIETANFPRLQELLIRQRAPLANAEAAKVALLFAVRSHYGATLSYVKEKRPDIESLITQMDLTNQDFLALLHSREYHWASLFFQKGRDPNIIELVKTTGVVKTQTTLGCFLQSLNTGFDEESSHSTSECEQLLALMVNKGLNVNQSVEYEFPDRGYKTPLEALEMFLDKPYRTTVYHKIAPLLLAAGASISSKTSLLWIQNKHDPAFHPYLDYLHAKGMLSEEELKQLKTPIEPGKRKYQDSTLIEKCHEYIAYITHMLVVANLNHDALDLTKIEEIKQLKKETKEVMKNQGAKPSTKAKDLFKLYDRIVDHHPWLSQLRQISKDLRSTTMTNRLVRFVGIMTQTWKFEHAMAKVESIRSNKRKPTWDNFYHRFVTQHELYKKDRYLTRHPLTLCHGADKNAALLIAKEGAILSMGQILAKKGLTLTGEHCGSHDSINANHISGERLSFNWEDGSRLYDVAYTRFMMAHVYATQAKHENDRDLELRFDPVTAVARIKHFETSEEIIKSNKWWFRLRFDIMRMRATNRITQSELQPLKSKLEQWLNNGRDEDIQAVIDAIDEQNPSTFTDEELKFIDSPPYGVIFASTTVLSAAHPPHIKREFLAPGPLRLGHQIQVAFTDKDKCQELGQLFSRYGHNIRVYTFEMGYHLEMLNMMQGSALQNFLKSRGRDYWEQKRVAFELQTEVLPEYAKPFPANPTYFDPQQSKKVSLKRPFYDRDCADHTEYEKKVKDGLTIARKIHGPMHACRTSIWALLVTILYNEKDLQPDEIQYAAACHDRQRQDEGTDHWDNSSARWYLSRMLQRDQWNTTISEYNFALQNKDPEKGQFESIKQKALHDADCLEIVRVLKDPSEFRYEELCFLKECKRRKNLRALVDEIFDFIKMTEGTELKKHLESVDNYYGTVMRIMSFHRKRFPILNRILKYPLQEFSSIKIDATILNLLK